LDEAWAQKVPQNIPEPFARRLHPMCSEVRAQGTAMDNRLTAQQWTLRDGGAVDRGRPSRLQAEEVVCTLISWAGDDPTREGLLDTPERVVRAYEEWFASYNEEPIQLLEALFRGNCWLRRNRPSS
jgi:hypothetical protein